MKDLWEQLEQTAHAYLPWWQYRRESGQPESALLTALGVLLQDTAAGLEHLADKHERAFLGAFPLKPQSVRPALAWTALSSPRWERIPAGTEFYLSGDGTRRWRIAETAWAGPCRLVRQVLAQGKTGKLLALPPPSPNAPTRLYDFRPQGAERREARFSHPAAFASQGGCTAALAFAQAAGPLAAFLADSAHADWFLETVEEEIPLQNPSLIEGKLVFCLPPAPEGQALVVRVKERALPPPLPVGRVTVETSRPHLPAEAVLTQDGFQRCDAFAPFGEEPSPWHFCCVRCEDALSLAGAEVTASWTASLGTRERLLPHSETRPLRPVMRRLPALPPEPREVYALSVAWEYWDGNGWRPLPEGEALAHLFGPLERSPSRLSATFTWPRDVGNCALQGREGRWLRWRVREAEGFDVLPRRSRFPEVTQLRFAARLPPSPVAAARRWGLEEAFSPVEEKEQLFPALSGPGDAWWLGFDPPPRGGTLALWLTLAGRGPEGRFTAWEALPQGGKRPLTMEDGTAGLSHSGVIRLRGVLGKPSARFGERLWWLCLQNEDAASSGRAVPPVLTGLSCGAALLEGTTGEPCAQGEGVRPLRGGTVSGVILAGDGGGLPEDEDARTLSQARNLQCHLGRGISGGDISRLLRDALPDVVQARCVRVGTSMEVCVLLREGERCHAAFGWREREILGVLERETVLPILGWEVRVRQPRFYAIHTSVWLEPPEGGDGAALRRLAAETLEEFLHPVTGGPEGKGWPMGVLPGGEVIAERLRAALPGARLAGILAVAAAPEGTERETDKVEDPFALPMSGVHTVWIQEGTP